MGEESRSALVSRHRVTARAPTVRVPEARAHADAASCSVTSLQPTSRRNYALSSDARAPWLAGDETLSARTQCQQASQLAVSEVVRKRLATVTSPSAANGDRANRRIGFVDIDIPARRHKSVASRR